MAEKELQLRSYEVSIWTLQDSFITVLKAADTEHKGAIQNGTFEISDDGTETLNFTVPKFYRFRGKLIPNPLWQYILDGHIVANMHKIKLIFNKAAEDESIFELLVTNVSDNHEADALTCDITCEGLAFHELGKIGYKISLSDEDFLDENEEWFNEYHQLFEENQVEDYATLNPPEAPIMNLQYWNDKIFYYTDEEGNRQQKYAWDYVLQMDWSDTSVAEDRSPQRVYDEEYVASWDLDQNKGEIYPTRIEKFKEKSRSIESEQSNIYNITQTIAEKFGVYCKYVYDHDENYHIIGKHVIYYNNNFVDISKHIDITYPYNTGSIKRILDNSELATKLFVQPVSDSNTAENLISIATAPPNKSKEDYILNFDYLHQIHTITDEQYEAVQQFEYEVAKYNYKLEWISDRINIYETKFNEVLANIAFYENALNLDKERLDDANKRMLALTEGDATIECTESNPRRLSFKTNPNNDLIGDVDVTLEGVLPASVKIYQNRDYKTGTLKDELSGDFKLDSYGYLIGINNIRVNTSPDKITIVYMTCSYEPKNYNERVIEAWEARIKDDERRLKEANDEAVEYGARLYGSDTGYALAEWNRVEWAFAGTSMAMEGEGHGQGIGWGVANGTYADEAIVEDAHGLYCMYDIYSLRKQILITKFERMMGPALREGYWTPDGYQDYGNQYIDYFQTPEFVTNTISTKRPDIQFTWDEINQFAGETQLTYEEGVDQQIRHYYVLSLKEHMNVVSNNIKDLCLFYYDLGFITACKELDERYKSFQNEYNNATEEQTRINAQAQMKAIKDEIDKMLEPSRILRWVTVGSQCTYAYVKNKDHPEENGNYPVIPALIIQESAKFTDTTWNALNGRSARKEHPTMDLSDVEICGQHIDARPFLGVVTTNQEVVDAKVVGENIEYRRLTPRITDAEILVGYPDISEEEQYYNKMDDLVIVKPRIVIDSLHLKPASVLLSLNNTNLSSPENFSTFVEIDQTTDEEKYYITIKPEVLMGTLAEKKTFYINYNISNAAEEIYLDALKIAKENSRPKVSYEVALNAFNKASVREIQDYLRRVVYINDAEMQFDNVAGYISKLTLDLDHPWQDTAEIKNYETKFEDLFSTIVAQTESMKKNESALTVAMQAFTTGGILQADVIKDSMLKADLNYAFNQGTLTIDEKQGIWGTSEDGVIAIRGGGIFTATEKDADGNWKWNTGILPTGINADLITSGQLDTNRIRIYAGNKVAFQMNGEGIFAYKNLDSSDEINLSEEDYNKLIDNYADGIDSRQYVTYNDNGLFLTVKNGAKVVYTKNENGPINNMLYEHNGDTVNRVEISWDGLILRNWEGQKTFWADPDTGNLHLKGSIDAEGGVIGAWSITDGGGLSSEYMQLNNTGISLNSTKTSEVVTQITYNNEAYTAYYIDGSPETLYYIKDTSPTHIITDESETILMYKQEPTSAEPKYSPIAVTPTGDTGENTVYYIAADDSGTNYVTDKDGNNILYDFSTLTNSSWYQKLTELGITNRDKYVEYLSYTSVLAETTLSLNTSLNLLGYKATFSVNAKNGYVNINSGTLGPFTLSQTKLSGGSTNDLNQNGIVEYVSVKNSAIEGYSTSLYGRMITNIYGNSKKGTIGFERVDGTKGNFNIADMQYFKDRMSAEFERGKAKGEANMATAVSNARVEGWNLARDKGKSTWGDKTVVVGNGVTINIPGASYNTQTSFRVTAVNSGGGGGCFIAGTPIQLSNNKTLPIEQLTVGTKVIAYDEINKAYDGATIIGIRAYYHKKNIFDIVLSTNDIITATSTHPILTTTGWKAVDPILAVQDLEHNMEITELQVGDEVINITGQKIYIREINLRTDLIDTTVYNIDVEPYDTYLVHNIVVHNSKDTPDL